MYVDTYLLSNSNSAIFLPLNGTYDWYVAINLILKGINIVKPFGVYRQKQLFAIKMFWYHAKPYETLHVNGLAS